MAKIAKIAKIAGIARIAGLTQRSRGSTDTHFDSRSVEWARSAALKAVRERLLV